MACRWKSLPCPSRTTAPILHRASQGPGWVSISLQSAPPPRLLPCLHLLSRTWGPCQPPPRGGPRQLHSGPSKRSMLGLGPGWRLRAGVPCLYPALTPHFPFLFRPSRFCTSIYSDPLTAESCDALSLRRFGFQGGLHLGGYCWCYAQKFSSSEGVGPPPAPQEG